MSNSNIGGFVSSKTKKVNTILTNKINADRLFSPEIAPGGLVKFVLNLNIIHEQNNPLLSGIGSPLTGASIVLAQQMIDGNLIVDSTSGPVTLTTDTAVNIIALMVNNNSVGRSIGINITDIGQGANGVVLNGGVGVTTPGGTTNFGSFTAYIQTTSTIVII